MKTLITALSLSVFLVAGELFASALANDNFTNATVIALSSGEADIDTSAATVELGEPAHYDNTGGPHHSLWWSFTSAQNGTLTIDTVGSVFDTVLALYTGTELATLWRVASNDSAGDDAMHSRIEYLLAVDITCQIALDGYSDNDNGAACLHWIFTPTATNDYIVTLTAPLATGYPSNILVTAGESYAELPQPSVSGYVFGGWWNEDGGMGTEVTNAMTVTQNVNHALYADFSPAVYRVTFDPSGNGTTQQVYDVTFEGAWPAVASPILVGYVFDGWFTLDGQQVDLNAPVALQTDQTLLAQWTAALASAPANDDFTNATVIAASAGVVDTDTFAATAESGEPAHYDNAGGPYHSLWWNFTSARNGTLTVDTEGSVFDTVLALYTGSELATLRRAVSNDSAGDDVMHSRIEYLLASNITCHIALDGYSDNDNGAACLNWVFTPAATNDYIVTLTAPLATGYPSNIMVTAGEPYGELPQPSASGYVFGGWWSEDGGTGTEVTNAMTVTQNINHALYAKFSSVVCRVTFDPSGNGTTPQVCDVTFGGAWPALASPIFAGYVFDGWFTLDGQQVDLNAPVALQTDQTLLAQWIVAPASAPINDDFTNATVIVASAGVADTDTSAATAESGEPAHYDNAGGPYHSLWWNFTSTQNGTLSVDTEGSVFDTVLALYTGSELDTLRRAVSNDSAGDDAMHSRVEYLLAADASCYIALDGYSSNDNGAACLNWVFTPAAANDYIVTLTAPLATGYPSNILVTAGEPYGELPQPLASGYVFGGWWSEDGGTGTEITNAMTVTQNANHVLYANFSPVVCRVTFDPSGNGTTQQVYDVTFGGAWPVIASPVHAGYVFGGWVTTDDQQVDLNTPVTLQVDQTLLAQWTAALASAPANDNFTNATVIAASSGAVDTSAATAEPGEPAHYDNAGGPHHTLWWNFTSAQNGTLTIDTEGSVFDTVLALYTGSELATLWRVASNDSAGDDAMHSRVEYLLASNITCHVVLDGYSDNDNGAACLNWVFTPTAVDDYIVTLTAPLANGYPSNIMVTAGEPYGELPQPSASGYVFGGWWSEDGGTGTEITNAMTVTQNINHALYAKFSSVVCRVTFDPSGNGTTPQVCDVTFGGAWPVVASPVLAGYVFNGWFTSGYQQVDLNASVALQADQTLFARWTVDLLTSNGTPHSWMQAYGLTNQAFEIEDIEDRDGDGFEAWQEYIADTDPTNKDSCLLLTGVKILTNGVEVNWKGGVKATQWIEMRQSLDQAGEPWIAIFTNMPPTATATNFTDKDSASGTRFYRIRTSR